MNPYTNSYIRVRSFNKSRPNTQKYHRMTSHIFPKKEQKLGREIVKGKRTKIRICSIGNIFLRAASSSWQRSKKERRVTGGVIHHHHLSPGPLLSGTCHPWTGFSRIAGQGCNTHVPRDKQFFLESCYLVLQKIGKSSHCLK